MYEPLIDGHVCWSCNYRLSITGYWLYQTYLWLSISNCHLVSITDYPQLWQAEGSLLISSVTSNRQGGRQGDVQKDRQTDTDRHKQTGRQAWKQVRQADRPTDMQTDRQADRHVGSQTDREIGRQTVRQTGRQPDRQTTDRQTDRQSDRQAGSALYLCVTSTSIVNDNRKIWKIFESDFRLPAV
jgi:hypothetical protein